MGGESRFFRKIEIFFLIKCIRQNHPCTNRIQSQPHRSTENTLVQWLEWLTAKQAIWIQSLAKVCESFVTFILLKSSN